MGYIINLFRTKFMKMVMYLFSINLLGLFYMTIFRWILCIFCSDYFINEPNKTFVYNKIFIKGFRFDNVISSYILVFPLIILLILGLLNKSNRKIIKTANVYFIIAYTLVFATLSINIPYFMYFLRHINSSVFNWLEYGGDASLMILEEKSYWIFFLIFILTSLSFLFFVIKISKVIFHEKNVNLKNKEFIPALFISLILLLMCIFGIRGNVRQKERLQIAYAFFSMNSVYNQLPINPVFFFFKSLYSSTSHYLMEQDKAIETTEKILGLSLKDNNYNRPRNIEEYNLNNNPNIVIIFMESLSNEYILINRDNAPLTPFLRELIDKSYYFDRFFSQGIHTNQGITSTLYGFPSILDYHMFKTYLINEISRSVISIFNQESQEEDLIPQYYGLPFDLKKYGYNNLFFMSHTPTFDNIESFLYKNGFDDVYHLHRYDAPSSVNNWGISDSDLFKNALSIFNLQHKKNIPFLGTIMTISNHPPYYYTDDFKNRGINDSEHSVAYADSCLKTFFEEASKEEWFSNTIFVILGDHGKNVGEIKYDIPLSLNHVPLIIFSPLFRDMPQQIHNLASQIDVYPTLMGILGIPCSYYSFGIDVLKHKRDYVFFSTDDKIGCINNDFLFTYNLSSKTKALYTYTKENNSNILDENKSIADSMETYSFAMIESARYILKNKLIRQK